MRSQDVVNLYNQLHSLGIEIWIDGGWGVDALLQANTRHHRDLDIAIQWKDVPILRETLEKQGFKEVRQDSQWNFVLADHHGREIDVHAFVFDAKGDVVEGIMYPKESLTGTGVIDNQIVRCISPEYMVKFHTGYAIRESDIKDVTALCERFGIEYPEEYARLKKPEYLKISQNPEW